MALPARETALKCLLAWEKRGAWPDGFLNGAMRAAGLDRRDAALCERLSYGVLQNRMLLDWHLDRVSSVKTRRMEPGVSNALRLGLYQLLFLDRVPAHAAVDQSVALARRYSRNPRAAGLVNGVLRTLERERAGGLPEPEALSVRYSHPAWLVEEFSRALSAGEVEALLRANNDQPPTTVQVNTQRTTCRSLAQELAREGVSAAVHPWLPDCLELSDTGALERLQAFQAGKFYVQDAAARLAVLAAGVEPGMAVLDACAAPGGKSFAAALQLDGRGSVLACELHPGRRDRIREGAARLGFSCIRARVMDAKVFAPALEGRFDLVIADVPCSGLGVIRKKPDIRYREAGALEGLPKVQGAILDNVSRYVKPGGKLLYATCTVLRRENEEVAAAFARRHRQFAPQPFRVPGPVDGASGMATLWPHRQGTDGFFFAVFRRQQEALA